MTLTNNATTLPASSKQDTIIEEGIEQDFTNAIRNAVASEILKKVISEPVFSIEKAVCQIEIKVNHSSNDRIYHTAMEKRENLIS